MDEMLVAEPTLCTPVYGHKGSVTLPVLHESPGGFSSDDELLKWHTRELARIQESIPIESQRMAVQGLETEFQSLRSTTVPDHKLPSFALPEESQGCCDP